MAALLVACGDEGTLRTDGRAFTPVATATRTATATATPSPTATHAPPGHIRVAFVGDLMLDREVEVAMEVDPGYPLARTGDLFRDADLVVGNLEGTLSDVGTPMEKQYVFATDPALVTGLAPFWAVTLANNHATDYGLAGLERTIEVLDAQGIAWFGAGSTEAEARAGIVGRGEGTPTIGYLGYSDIGETLHASGEQGGVSRASIEAMTADIARLRARGDMDFVVVTLHAGTEYSHESTARQQELARAAIDAGADLVVGHHPHVLQPVEEYHGGLIFYSLGNFVFDLDAEDLETLGEGPFQSVVAVVSFETGVPLTLASVEFRPARIDVEENRPRPATPEEADAILALLGVPPTP